MTTYKQIKEHINKHFFIDVWNKEIYFTKYKRYKYNVSGVFSCPVYFAASISSSNNLHEHINLFKRAIYEEMA